MAVLMTWGSAEADDRGEVAYAAPKPPVAGAVPFAGGFGPQTTVVRWNDYYDGKRESKEVPLPWVMWNCPQ